MTGDREDALQANVEEAERKYLDAEPLEPHEARIIALSLYRGGCHACQQEM